MRGWKNIFHENGKQKKAGVVIFISDKIDLKIKNITRDKERYYMLIKWSIQKEDITIVNIYAPGHGIRPHHFMASRWGNSGNSVRLYFGGAPKSLQMVTSAMKLKGAYSLEGKL